MGGLGKLVSALPGGDKALNAGQVDEHELDRTEAIINSMTKEERAKPTLLNGLAPQAHRRWVRHVDPAGQSAHQAL